MLCQLCPIKAISDCQKQTTSACNLKNRQTTKNKFYQPKTYELYKSQFMALFVFHERPNANNMSDKIRFFVVSKSSVDSHKSSR